MPNTSQHFKALGKQSWLTLSDSSCKHLAGLLNGRSGFPSALFTPPAWKDGDGSNKESKPVQAEQQGAWPQWAEKQAQLLCNALQFMKMMSEVCINQLINSEGSVPGHTFSCQLASFIWRLQHRNKKTSSCTLWSNSFDSSVESQTRVASCMRCLFL